jgi:amino acid permease
VFALVVLCLGSGTLTFPYIFYVNGPLLAIGIIAFGAAVSTYTGYLITICAEKCNARRYEDIALKTYGRRCATFTSIMMLLTMMGFVIAYMVLLKTLLPSTLHTLMKKDIPRWIDDNAAG